MRRILLAIGAVALVGACCKPKVEPIRVGFASKAATSCTIQIRHLDSESGASGVALVNRRGRKFVAVTAHHVVDDAAKFRARFEDGPWFEVTVSRSEKNKDLAIVEGPAPEKDGCEATIGPPAARGDVVFSTGYPPREPMQVTQGRIRAILDVDGNRTYMSTAEGGPGWSGGALWNARGALIGIVRAGYARMTPFGAFQVPGKMLVVHTSILSDFLSGEKTKDGKRIE